MKKTMMISMMSVSLLFACSTPEVVPPGPITLSRIDLCLSVGTGATGTVTVELRDAVGATPALWESTVDEVDLVQDPGNNWNSFAVPDIDLENGRTYRIYVTRSDAHDNGSQNTISWASSLTSGDLYPAGVSSVSNADVDFTFRIFNGAAIDQQMETADYGYGLSNSDYWWQSFVPGN